MNPSAGVNMITQCTVVLGQYALSSPAQFWVFGSDPRIYPFVGDTPVTTYCLDLGPHYAPSPGNGTPLVFNLAISGKITQQWTWNPNTGALANLGTPPGYFVDLSKGSVSSGNKIQIWNPSSANPNQNEI